MTDQAVVTTPSTPDPVSPDAKPTPTSTTDSGVSVEYNGKVLTKDDVLTKMKAQDEFIERLKQERAVDRVKVDELLQLVKQGSTVEDLLKPKPAESKETPKAGNPEEIASLVMQRIEADRKATEQKSTAEANIAKVNEAATQAWGDKAKEQFDAKAQQLGLTAAQVAHLAANTPQVLLALIPTPAAKPGGVAPTKHTPSGGNTPQDAVAAAVNEWRSARGTRATFEAFQRAIKAAEQA